METFLVGMGCFWGAERKFWEQEGVHSTAVGYASGFTRQDDDNAFPNSNDDGFGFTINFDRGLVRPARSPRLARREASARSRRRP